MSVDHRITTESRLLTTCAELAELLAATVKNKYYRNTFDRQAYQLRALNKLLLSVSDAKEKMKEPICLTCGLVFSSFRSLSLHQRKHQKEYECRLQRCEHQNSVYWVGGANGGYECKDCGKKSQHLADFAEPRLST